MVKDIPAFSRCWFETKQSSLLFLCNNIITRKWFRRILDIETDKLITQITPYEVTWQEDPEWLTTEFHIARKFAVRLHNELGKVWQLCHQFDMHVANKFLPAFNLGFDQLIQFPNAHPETDSVDGEMWQETTDASWTTLVAAAGNNVTDDVSNDNMCGGRGGSAPNSDKWQDLWRSGYVFNVSAMGVGAIISTSPSPKFELRGSGVDTSGYSAMRPNIYGFTPASNTTLVATDYANVGSTEYCSSYIQSTSWNASGYNSFTLNTAGRSAIDPAAYFKVSLRDSLHDIGNYNTSGSAYGFHVVKGYYADDTTASNGKDPKLTVTYSPLVRFMAPCQMII